MARSDAAHVTRRSFSRLPEPLDVPHLIDIQRRSFAALTDPKTGLLRATIDDISPIEDYTGNLAIVFGSFEFDEPTHTIAECREKDITYSRPLNVTVAFQNRETGEIREQTVFMGDFPWMTDRGTFIINGTERVVVTQLVRSPGAYVMEPKDAREAGLHRQPDAGPRLLARARDRQEGPRLRAHRPQAQAPGHGAAAGDGVRHRRADPRPVRQLGLHPAHDRGRHRADPDRGGRPDRAVQEAAPGRAAVGRRGQGPARPALLRLEALRPDQGRALQAQRPARPRRRPRPSHPDQGRHRRPDQGAGHAAEAARRAGGDRRGEPDQGLRRRGGSPTRATRSPITSTSTSTSATAACAPSAS